MQGNPNARNAAQSQDTQDLNDTRLLFGQLSNDNPFKPPFKGSDAFKYNQPASDLAMAWERQNGFFSGHVNQTPEQKREELVQIAEADPEGTYAQLRRDQFQDYMDRIFPHQLEAVDIALGLDREREAMRLAQTSGQFRPSTALQYLHSQPMFLGVNQAMHDVYQQIDEQHWANPVVQEQMRQYGFNQLAEQERNEIADTTSRAFGVGAGIQSRRNQRYGLQTDPSRVQERNRGLSQSLATAGGVNQMRDRREARQAELITGGASAINQQRGALGG